MTTEEHPSKAEQKREAAAIKEVPPEGAPQHVNVNVGGSGGSDSPVTLTLAHHLDVDANGRPAKLSGSTVARALRPGDTWKGARNDAESLIGSGWVLGVDPDDAAAVRAVLG